MTSLSSSALKMHKPPAGDQYAEYDVCVGRILSVHGLRGEVKVASGSDVPDRYHTLKSVCVKGPAVQAHMNIAEAREIGRSLWLMRFEGITDRDAAQKLRGAMLMVREQDSPSLPPEVFFIHQIVGLEVQTVAGRSLGPVREVLETGANDVYVTDAGLIPAIRQVVKKIDIARNIMIVDPLPGMLDEEPEHNAD